MFLYFFWNKESSGLFKAVKKTQHLPASVLGEVAGQRLDITRTTPSLVLSSHCDFHQRDFAPSPEITYSAFSSVKKKITIHKHVAKWSFQERTFTQQKQNYRFNKHKTSKFNKASETKRLRSVKTRQEFEILTPSNCKKGHLLLSCLSEKAHCSVFFLMKIVFVPGSPKRAFQRDHQQPPAATVVCF